MPGVLVDDEEANLTRIELRGVSIEPFWMYGFKLRGIDPPLIDRDLQPAKNGRQGIVDISVFVVTDDPTGPVDQGQVFLEAEQDADLDFVGQLIFKGQRNSEGHPPCKMQGSTNQIVEYSSVKLIPNTAQLVIKLCISQYC